MNWNEKREVLKEAAAMICGYCAFPERWHPATRGWNGVWWHLIRGTANVRNSCGASVIWQKIDDIDKAMRDIERDKGD